MSISSNVEGGGIRQLLEIPPSSGTEEEVISTRSKESNTAKNTTISRKRYNSSIYYEGRGTKGRQLPGKTEKKKQPEDVREAAAMLYTNSTASPAARLRAHCGPAPAPAGGYSTGPPGQAKTGGALQTGNRPLARPAPPAGLRPKAGPPLPRAGVPAGSSPPSPPPTPGGERALNGSSAAARPSRVRRRPALNGSSLPPPPYFQT